MVARNVHIARGTFQTALDKESVVKATPFYQAVMRQDQSQQDRETGATAEDDPHAVRSAGSLVADAAMRMATNGPRPKAILLQASLTSVLFELVRSNPWETVMRACMSGLKASFSLNEEGVSACDATAALSVAVFVCCSVLFFV